MTFPLAWAHQNLLFGVEGGRAALYRLDVASYPYKSATDKRRLLVQLARMAAQLQADFSLYRVSRAYPASSYAADAMSMVDPRHADPDQWLQYLQGHEQHLAGLRSFLPEVYVAVTLPGSAAADLRSRVGAAARRVRRRAIPVSGRELERLQAAEQQAFARVTTSLSGRRATTQELQWLLRRGAYRGLGEPPIDEHWQPAALAVTTPDGRVAYEPLGTDLVRHANDPLDPHPTRVEVETESGRSFQAMLAVGALPEVSDFPGGAELLFTPLEGADFPVDAVLHCRWMANHDARTLVRKRVVDADNQYVAERSSGHGALSFTAEENRVLARQLDRYLKGDGRPPLLKAAISLAVGATNGEELERRVEHLRHLYPIRLERPVGEQARLFLDHLPRTDTGGMRQYQEILTVEQFAGLMPIAGHHAGPDKGVYVGRTTGGARRPVKFDITEAPRTGRAPSILLAGTLGSGKTIAAELLAYQAAMRGSLVVDVDPKPDHNLEGVPGLAGRVQVIELLGDGRHRGLLDPMVIGTPSMREDLAATYLMDLLPQAPPAWETHVRRHVRTVIELEQAPTSSMVLWSMLNAADPDAKAAGEALEIWADTPIGRLAFARDGHRDVQAEQRRQVTTIKAAGLALPDPAVPKTDYDQNERLGAATLKLIAAYAMALVTGDRSTHKVVLLDEAWYLLASRDGRRLIDRLNRMGRTHNATLLLASQGLADVGDLENLIGTRFVFGQETSSEARRALELLDLDPHDRALVDRVRSYRAGRCLLRDIHGQVAEVQVDLVSGELLGVLDTNPRQRAAA